MTHQINMMNQGYSQVQLQMKKPYSSNVDMLRASQVSSVSQSQAA